MKYQSLSCWRGCGDVFLCSKYQPQRNVLSRLDEAPLPPIAARRTRAMKPIWKSKKREKLKRFQRFFILLSWVQPTLRVFPQASWLGRRTRRWFGSAAVRALSAVLVERWTGIGERLGIGGFLLSWRSSSLGGGGSLGRIGESLKRCGWIHWRVAAWGRRRVGRSFGRLGGSRECRRLIHLVRGDCKQPHHRHRAEVLVAVVIQNIELQWKRDVKFKKKVNGTLAEPLLPWHI